MRIAVIADVHYGDQDSGPRRRCSIADILLKRAVFRCNRLIRPDVVLALGDLVDDGKAPAAPERLRTLRAILDELACPYIAIPGNHDGDTEQFYSVFDRPEPIEDIGGVRFLSFVDREEPGYNATRSEEDLDRVRVTRTGYNGPIVCLQHVCLFPPGRDIAPYNYTNAPEIIRAMKESGVGLSVSGHHHHGGEDVEDGNVLFVNAPGLCEAPFPFIEIILNGDKWCSKRHELVMQQQLKLVDQHVHTELAYCSQNMTVEKTITLARDFGLAGVIFTEHSGQLYFDRKPYWQNAWLEKGMEAAEKAYNRMPSYLELKRQYEDDFARFSLEVECDMHGRLVLDSADRKTFDYIIGTIHALPGLTREAPPQQRDVNTFLRLVDAMGRQGIRALAHPLRVFMRLGWDTPTALFEPTAKLLAEHGIAAEINFHSDNRPPVAFIRYCLDNGVRFSFGSDSHTLAEVGDFACHIDLLERAGYNGDLADILV